MKYDKNHTTISGEVTFIDKFTTKKENIALNLNLKSEGRYSDIIPCVAYGPMAEKIFDEIDPGMKVTIIGRTMTIPSKDPKVLVPRIVIEEIGIQLIVEEND